MYNCRFLYHWDMNTCVAKHQPMNFGGPLFDAKFNNSPDVLSVLSSTDLLLMDMRSHNREVHQCTIRASKSMVSSTSTPSSPGKLAWHRSGNTVAVTFYDGGVSLFDMRNLATFLVKHVAKEETIADICWHPSSPDHLVCSTERGHVLVWSCPADETLRDLSTAPVFNSRVGGSAV